ncbi:GNAT family N-acetyltransferase [Erwinia psidii]|uniref:GNAT family N-acetyltransferase n=1 Tax=Erwinia psidii TaxID=69224 RepID=A0A3N6RV16_9GAMM|nr:GNAT family N-acetyltransferase [Erwinia psidii]MCX8959006.1 GNAT family N-acetyltransferase [Erwinia psidii]MCX8962794.1 GNAT family N-acetyltransferase [Erwinia psidii]MCX8966112.1 GNAT family N-acetyltransferase [Erwinia psidii]RQM36764.1 GNAT family N-acetyltransferase [Erwinia psidii]
MIVIRDFVADDADGISELFREVYGDRYVYSDLYMPTMIVWHNAQRHWHSAVAVENGCIIGHAALWMNEDAPCAELAMFATHPKTRRRGVATRLGRHLRCEARKQQLTMLTIKMVCSHPHSQRMAKNLGFDAIALLRDYVVSPFESGSLESVILGVLPLQPCPVPQIVGMHGQHHWLSLLSARFGSTLPPCTVQTTSALEMTDIGNRVEVTLYQPTNRITDEITRLPHSRLIYLRAQISTALAEALPMLYRAGYRDSGLMPDNRGGWFWLFQRGFRRQELQLCCPIAQMLQTYLLSA